MPDIYLFARNGMGNYLTGTGMREDMLMQFFNILLDQPGVVLSGDFAVTETSTPSMAVTVAAGRAFILNSSYTVNTPNLTRFWGVLAEEFELAISSNSSGSTRYDIAVVSIDTGATPNDYATNVATVEIVEGTPGAGVPATPSNALKLAEIEVADGAASITDAEITDSRTFVSIDDTFLGKAFDDTSWTPALYKSDGVTSLSGTVQISKFEKDGRRITMQLSVSAIGDPSGSKIYIDLPELAKVESANNIVIGAGYCSDGANKMCYAYIETGDDDKAVISVYGVTAWGASNSFNLTMVYESAT